jgi:prevent-host-death family protein
MQVNMHEAKTHFSKLVDRALAGESVIIARNGKPVLTLSPLKSEPGPRVPGLSAGRGRVSANFDDPLDDTVLREFE